MYIVVRAPDVVTVTIEVLVITWLSLHGPNIVHMTGAAPEAATRRLALDAHALSQGVRKFYE